MQLPVMQPRPSETNSLVGTGRTCLFEERHMTLDREEDRSGEHLGQSQSGRL